MLAVLVRLMIPVVIAFIAVRTIRQMLGGGKGTGGPSGRDQVIDICTECGNVRQKGHRCQWKDT